MTKQVDNLQPRDGDKLQGQEEPEENTRNIQLFKIFSCLPSKPVTIVLTRQTAQLLLNCWPRLLGFFVYKWGKEMSSSMDTVEGTYHRCAGEEVGLIFEKEP